MAQHRRAGGRAGPKAIIDLLAERTAAVLAQPELRAKAAALGFEPQPTSPEVFGKRVADEVALWAKLTKHSGLEPQ